MPPNNRWHYELLMQTVSRIRARNRVRVEEASYSPCSLLPFSPFESGPFFFRPRGWPRIQRDTSNEASFNSFNSTDLQRLVPFPLPLLLFPLLLLSEESNFQKRAAVTSCQVVNEGAGRLVYGKLEKEIAADYRLSLPSTHQTFFLNGALNATSFLSITLLSPGIGERGA